MPGATDPSLLPPAVQTIVSPGSTLPNLSLRSTVGLLVSVLPASAVCGLGEAIESTLPTPGTGVMLKTLPMALNGMLPYVAAAVTAYPPAAALIATVLNVATPATAGVDSTVSPAAKLFWLSFSVTNPLKPATVTPLRSTTVATTGMFVPATIGAPAAGAMVRTTARGAFAVATNSTLLKNITPGGACPPTAAVASSLLRPGVVPRVQHAPATPLVSVGTTTELALNGVTQALSAASRATAPPPAVTVKVIGTSSSALPRKVFTSTFGRQPTARPVPIGASVARQAAAAFSSARICSSITVPPTPPLIDTSGSTRANGLSSITVPPTPPP